MEIKKCVWMPSLIVGFIVLMLVLTMAGSRIFVLEKDSSSGKRVDGFRCSDAKAAFVQVGVYIDCVKIEEEINGNK